MTSYQVWQYGSSVGLDIVQNLVIPSQTFSPLLIYLITSLWTNKQQQGAQAMSIRPESSFVCGVKHSEATNMNHKTRPHQKALIQLGAPTLTLVSIATVWIRKFA